MELWSVYICLEPTLCTCASESHCCLPRVLWAAGCIQQPKLLFLQHLAISGFPHSDHTIKHSKSGLQANMWRPHHSQNSASHLHGLQGLQQTPANKNHDLNDQFPYVILRTKNCSQNIKNFGSGSEFSAMQWRLFPLWASVIRDYQYGFKDNTGTVFYRTA